ncbi:hypothetical protein BLX24_23890 [Arsenicibacter rosenii]|uniref:Dystroglycan-type cadherin-like domain-containing protein n=2 Tax=Arsenicibacter rosenii TaxID=1750698 RepID=A0A1S2VD47_9BACT|nr:hypothetical protein BLX24_23890 [Arsenicibacter rosenii]
MLLCMLVIGRLGAAQSLPPSYTATPPGSSTQNKSGLDYTNQDYDKILPASPGAAALGTYGEIPVSLYTGTPSITIPVYELTGVELKLPITLSYRASGVRVEDNASWVGLGWSLEAGGVITRSVRDKAEQQAGSGVRVPLPLGNSTASLNTLKNTGNTNYDFEPDIFYYNFMGMSGSFVFDATGKPRFSNQASYQVSYTTTSALSSQNNFTIVTDNGNRYEFNGQEITTNGTGAVTAWYLTKITSASGKEVIVFNYVDESYGYHMPARSSRLITPNGQSGYLSAPGYTDFAYERFVSILGKRLTTITFQGLATVEFKASPRQDLYTSSTQGAGYLDEITIKDVGGVVKKVVDLQYQSVKTSDPYQALSVNPCKDANGCPYLNYRLYLTGVQDKSDASLTNPPTYRFEYYGRNTAGEDLLPNKVSANQDHWGYYNYNTLYNKDLNPGFCGPFGDADTEFYNLFQRCDPAAGITSLNLWQIGGANREPYFPASQYGSLQRITYPTGGQSEFIYEPHQYQYVGATGVPAPTSNELYCYGPDYAKRYAGGIRIREIINRIDGQPVKQTEYTYENGVLRAKPHYYSYFYWSTYDGVTRKSPFPECGTIGGSSGYTSDRHLYVEINSGMVTDHGYRGGTHIGYGKVTERTFTTSNAGRIYNGKTVYEYNSERDSPTGYSAAIASLFSQSGQTITDYRESAITDQYAWPFFPGQNLDWAHGQLLRKTVMNVSDQTVFKQESYYTNSSLGTIPAAKVFEVRKDKEYYFVNYDFTEGWPRLTSQVETTYDLNGQNGIVVTKSFDYAATNHKYLTGETMMGSDGSTAQTRLTYVEDYANTAMNGTIATLKSKNILNKVIGNQLLRNNLTTQHRITQYNPDGQPISIHQLETVQPVPVTVDPASVLPTVPVSATYVPKTQITYANKVQQTITQTDGLNTTYLWGYNYMRPVAEISNATAAQLTATGVDLSPLTSSTVSDAGIQSVLAALRPKLPQSLIKGFTHDVLFGTTTEISPAGISTYYRYDALGRLKQILNTNQAVVKRYEYAYRLAGPTVSLPLTGVSAVVGQSFSYSVPANTFSDPASMTVSIDPAGAPAWMTVNGKVISGTPPAGSEGLMYTLSVKAVNQSGGVTYATLPVAVVAPAPLRLLPPTYDCNTGIFSFNVTGGDGTPVYFLSTDITGWTTKRTGHSVQFYCDAFPLTLYARQGSTIVNMSWSWQTYCQSVKQPPVRDYSIQIPNLTATTGVPFSYTFPAMAFYDQDGYPLTFSVSGLPVGLTFNAATGVISGTPVSAGTFTLNYKATNNACMTNLAIPTLTIQACTQPQPPVLSANPTTICPNQSAVITAGGCSGGVIRWSTGSTGTTLNVTTTGFYSATCVVNGCASNARSINLGAGATCCSTLPAAPVLAASQGTICPGQNVTLTASGCTGGTINWSTGSVGNTLVISGAGSYSATCTQNGCASLAGVLLVDEGAECYKLATSARIYTRPNPGWNIMFRYVGGVFQGSNDIINPLESKSWTTLATITTDPVADAWNSYAFAGNTVPYRYVRFVAGPNGYGELMEIEFYSGNTKITGTSFGSPATYNNQSNYVSGNVFDGNTTTMWHGATTGNSNYVGIGQESKVPPCVPPSAPVLTAGATGFCAGQGMILTAGGCSSGTITWAGGATGSSFTITTPGIYTATCKQGTCVSQPGSLTVPAITNCPPAPNGAVSLPALTVVAGAAMAYYLPLNAFTEPENQSMAYAASGLPGGVTINGFTISGVANTPGTYTATLTATDPYGASGSRSLVIIVSSQAVAFQLLAPSYNCSTGSFYFNSTGGNGSTVYYMAVGVTGWTTAAGPFTVLPYTDAQPFTLQGWQSGNFYTYTWDWKATCQTTNAPPVRNNAVSLPATLTAVTGNAFTYTIPAGVFTDPEGQAMTYAMSGLPAGLSFNPATQQISGTSSVTGSFTLTYQATDNANASASTQMVLVIYSACNCPGCNPCGLVATSARIYTRPNTSGVQLMYRYGGAVFQGSNDNQNWTTLASIIVYPNPGAWNSYTFTGNANVYKYLRFVAGPQGYGELMEIEFYNAAKKISGVMFGSTATYGGNQALYSFTNAFDGNQATMWHGAVPGNVNYVGITQP